VLIVSDIILILMLLTIAMYFGGKYNRPSMEANCVKQMQVDNKVDNNPFLVNVIDLQGAKVLVRPEQAIN
jgi:hypothetical protein